MFVIPLVVTKCHDKCGSITALWVSQGWNTSVFMVLQWGSLSYLVP